MHLIVLHATHSPDECDCYNIAQPFRPGLAVIPPPPLNDGLDFFVRRLRKLPKNREIVAYCRGPYCVLAFEAVAFLRQRGWKVRRLEDGFPEWKAAGLPVVERVAG